MVERLAHMWTQNTNSTTVSECILSSLSKQVKLCYVFYLLELLLYNSYSLKMYILTRVLFKNRIRLVGRKSYVVCDMSPFCKIDRKEMYSSAYPVLIEIQFLGYAYTYSCLY